MKIYINPGQSGNVLATVAIGKDYLNYWEHCALPGWGKYCIKHNLGLIVIDEEIIDKEDRTWKKATWQKLLIGRVLRENNISVRNICYLDSDILISPLAPNIFLHHDEERISVVSQVSGLRQPLIPTLRRLAFLRNKHWDSDYPLDSSLFMSPRQIFEYHGLPPHEEYVCAGMYVFNLNSHEGLLTGWFEKYDRNVQSITGGGDEPYFNHELLSWGKICWLPYEFQALWTYEVAWRYPFLFDKRYRNDELVRLCIESSLYTNHFLHFAGSWHECQMWKVGGFFEEDSKRVELEAFKSYLQTTITGAPKGMSRPS